MFYSDNLIFINGQHSRADFDGTSMVYGLSFCSVVIFHWTQSFIQLLVWLGHLSNNRIKNLQTSNTQALEFVCSSFVSKHWSYRSRRLQFCHSGLCFFFFPWYVFLYLLLLKRAKNCQILLLWYVLWWFPSS